jgi:hypothetical protein
MDTFCVPIGEVKKRARKLAINNIHKIYQEADRVLVLDSWIQGGSRNDHIKERATRILMSNWQRRLWTFQERVLAKNLYIQFRDGPQHADDLLVDTRIHTHFHGGFYHSIAAHGLSPILTLPQSGLGFRDQRPLQEKFDIAANRLNTRTTSWLSDKTICLGIILGLNTLPLQDIARENLDARTASFLRMVGFFC